MPIGKYFFWVGSILLAIILVSDWHFGDTTRTEVPREQSVDKTILRISSAYKWPEKIVFDTTQPTIVPLPSLATAAAPAPAPEMMAGANAKPAFEARAEMPPPVKATTTSQPKSRPRVAHRHSRPRNPQFASYPTTPYWSFGW